MEYTGEYINGNKEGYGILHIGDGIYEGQMKDGNMNGIGSFALKDKRKLWNLLHSSSVIFSLVIISL